MPSDYMRASTDGVTNPQQPPALPPIPSYRRVINASSPGTGRDAGIRRRNDPAEITGRIQNIFSNLGAALGTDSESEADRLAFLTRQVQAGRSFDDLRTSASNIARQATAPQQAPAAPREYPTGPLPLSPELERQLMQRGYEADETFARSEADRNLRATQAGVQSRLQMVDIDRWQQQTDLENQRRLAARGVARSPMFANPAQRQVFETANRAATEVRFGLQNTIAELDRALRQAESRRQAEFNQISLEEGVGRSDINRLLGVQ